MNISMVCKLCLFGVLIFSLTADAVRAQSRSSSQPVKKVRIRGIKGDKVPTPEYTVKRVTIKGRSVQQWYQLRTLYETDPEWIDQIDFRYYVLVRGKKGEKKVRLLRGEVSYVNVAKGRHESVMYLHPSTLARYGEVERVAVVVSVQGQVVDIAGEPKPKRRWWEEFSPQDGYVLNRMETPYAMINFDNYEAIKASGSKR